jgi:hypothetical protein
MGVMGCCQSKRRGKEDNFDDDINSMTMDDLKVQGGVFSQQTQAVSFKYQDDMMDKYISEHLLDEELTKVADMLSFESFLKVYKCALVWNRVKFLKQKKDLISKRRVALKDNNMTAYYEVMIQMQNDDTKCLQDVIEEVLE